MKPLKITILLSSPIAFPIKVKPYPLMFDSILIELMAQRAGRFDYDYNEYDSYSPENNERGVPLAVGGTRKKFYRASAIEVPKAEHTSLSIVSRTDWPEEQEIEKCAKWKREVIYVGSGLYRNSRELMPGIIAPIVNFYCVGDKEKIEDLLSDLKAIGVKTAIGMGRVEKVVVKEIAEDYSVIDKNGNPARPIPFDEHPGRGGWLRDYCSYKPPYWLIDNKDMCWIPPMYRWYPL